MMETKNMRGPWEFEPYGTHWSFAADTGRTDDFDFRVEFADGVTPEEQLATVTLIEAAPDLLEALEKIVAGLAEFDSNPRIYGEEVKKARAAIAKAKGDK